MHDLLYSSRPKQGCASLRDVLHLPGGATISLYQSIHAAPSHGHPTGRTPPSGPESEI